MVNHEDSRSLAMAYFDSLCVLMFDLNTELRGDVKKVVALGGAHQIDKNPLRG